MAAPEEDRFTRLPLTHEDMPSASYSGFLQISETKRVHYIFVESQSSPETDPVVVWFNGGPGCSSLIGFFKEHGPFVVDDENTNFTKNEHSWNIKTNMLYLEHPAGVGFSTVAKASELNYSDSSQAPDALKTLQVWYERFPKFGWNAQNNSLYIAGESYGGIYAPYLALELHIVNLKSSMGHSNGTRYNLKGFIVVNGVTDLNFDNYPIMAENLYHFNIIPKKYLDDFYADCIRTSHNSSAAAKARC